MIKFNLKSGKIERPPLIPKVRYTQDLLTRVLNEKGVEELKRIAEEEFGIKAKASKNLTEPAMWLASIKLLASFLSTNFISVFRADITMEILPILEFNILKIIGFLPNHSSSKI